VPEGLAVPPDPPGRPPAEPAARQPGNPPAPGPRPAGPATPPAPALRPASPATWPTSAAPVIPPEPAALAAEQAAAVRPVTPASRPAPAIPPAQPAPVAAPEPSPASGGLPSRSADDDGSEPFDALAFFNPYSGPPEGDDAWLAWVASPIADAYLDSQQRPAAREALAAGFTHGDHEPGARGFAAGGPLDVMEPGPVLAGFADDAIGDGLSRMDDDELAGVMCAARRLASWSASIELRAVSQLTCRRAAHAAATRDSRQADHVADEVAATLTLTCRAADKLLDLAAGVHRLPSVAAALATGRVDVPKVIVFCDELAGLDDAKAAGVADIVVPDAARMTTGELREVLHRAVLAVDPDAARTRRKKAQKDARVEAWTENRGTAALAGSDLPPADVLAADLRIDAAARSLKAAGAEGTLEQLRAKVFIALLTSQPLYTLLPGNPQGGQRDGDGGRQERGRPDHIGPVPGRPGHSDPAGNDAADGGLACPSPDDEARQGRNDQASPGNVVGDSGEDDGRDDGQDGGGTRRPQPSAPPSGPRGDPGVRSGPGGVVGLTGSVNLTVPLATWLGLTRTPGEAAGYGPLDADTARNLVTRLAGHPGNNWCLTVVGPDGKAVGHGCARTGPPRPGHAGPPRPGHAGPPRPGDTGPPRPGDTGPPRPGDTGPPGQRAVSGGAPASASAPPGHPAAPGRDPVERTSSAASASWLTGIKISWLETGDCGHRRETRAYQPSSLLRHLIKARDQTCCFPGCRRPARRCDDDHSIPFDQGGRTCECNLAPLCRRHHAAKQAPGWHLQQPRPGTLIWTLPRGRQYIVAPRPYAT
jgi:hypothetical protein